MKCCSNRWSVHWMCARFRAIFDCVCLVCLVLVLVGCEANLDLSSVNNQLSKPTQRADLFQSVAQHDGVVIAVGAMGVIVQSRDGGDAWQRTTLPGKPFLIDVTVCSDGSFHAIEKTDGIWSLQADGNWTRQALPEMTEPQAMTCNSSNVIWVTGGFSTIVHSVDAGASWDSWTMDEDLYLTTIQFVDKQHGIVTGEFGTVLLSSDNGASWERANDLPDSFYPQSTYFSNPDSGWIVGLNGTIWATGDGAQSWQKATSKINIPLYGVTGFGDTLVAVGDNATILYYRAGDSFWRPLENTRKTRTYLRAVTPISLNRFITAGGGGAIFTIDLPDNGTQASMETADE